MISKRPWKVVYGDWRYLRNDDEDKYVAQIVDADGDAIIETDCGVYGPEAEDAEFIVKAVNDYPL